MTLVAVSIAAIAHEGPARAQVPDAFPVEVTATQPGSSIEVRGAGRELAGG